MPCRLQRVFPGQGRPAGTILDQEVGRTQPLLQLPLLALSRVEQERRAHPRVAAPELPLRLADGANALRVRDISQSGVAFFSESSIPLWTTVKFELELPGPDGEAQTVRGEGAIVRCDRVSPAVGHYEVAVFFQHLDRDALNNLKAYLREALS